MTKIVEKNREIQRKGYHLPKLEKNHVLFLAELSSKGMAKFCLILLFNEVLKIEPFGFKL